MYYEFPGAATEILRSAFWVGQIPGEELNEECWANSIELKIESGFDRERGGTDRNRRLRRSRLAFYL